MLMDIAFLEPDKYYHCISESKEKNRWLTKGKVSKIFLGSNVDDRQYVSQSIKQGNDSSTLSGGVQWEVREATMEEEEWIEDCAAHRVLVPRKEVINYQIF